MRRTTRKRINRKALLATYPDYRKPRVQSGEDPSQVIANKFIEATESWVSPPKGLEYRKSYVINAQQRLRLLKMVEMTPSLGAIEWQKCAQDIHYWVENYVWTFDPRVKPSMLPFVAYEEQSKFLDWLKERDELREDGLAEKCRDVGFTWLCVIDMTHNWLFREFWKGGVGSRKESLVDRLGDADSILEKMRIILRFLPAWMLPKGYREVDHAKLLRITNPVNGSVITGEGGDNIGRGGRNSKYYLDEAAFIAKPDLVDAALSFNCDCKILFSTPNGMGNSFWKKRNSGIYPVFTFRWKHDPRKSRYEVLDEADKVVARGYGDPESVPPGCRVQWPWYEQQKLKYKHNPALLAQEVDIDYSASVDGITIPAAWVLAAVNYNIPVNEEAAPTAGLDIAAGGKNVTVFIERKGPVVTFIKAWNEANTTINAHTVYDLCIERGVRSLNYDAGGVGVGVGSVWDLMRNDFEDAQPSGWGTVRKPLPFNPVPIQSGESPTDRVWPDNRTSKERFMNLRAEAWWMLRIRFEKTYENAQGIAKHPVEECISIPDCTELVTQLSMPLHKRTSTGKIKIESKEDMDRRGVASPDYADTLMLCFYQPAYLGWARDMDFLKSLAETFPEINDNEIPLEQA